MTSIGTKTAPHVPVLVGEVIAALAELEVAGLAAEGDGLYRALR